MKKALQTIVSSIDIGTTKICVIVAALDRSGSVEIIGFGQSPSLGLHKGIVTDIAATVESIKKAVSEAEAMTGLQLESACVGISGGHIQSYNSQGVVAIKGKEVCQSDIDRVIDAARAIPIPDDQDILHIIPQYFKVDGQEAVANSLGMYGMRLEVQVHIVTGAIASAKNIIKSCELAGIKVCDIVLEQLASADAVLTSAEKELGVGILDIGGGTADFAVYKNGCIKHSKVIPVAGNHFTRDIALCCGIPFDQAERIKCLHGTIKKEQYMLTKRESIDVPLGYEGGVKSLDLAIVGNILHCRAEELADLLVDELLAFKLQHVMPTGLVVTGGGALLDGLPELFSQKLGCAVRIGSPEAVSFGQEFTLPDMLRSPVYATVYGLLYYVIHHRYRLSAGASQGVLVTRLFKKMQSWIYNFF